MSTEERLARLESEVEAERADLREIKSDVRAIRSELNRYKGAFGLAAFLISILLAAWNLIVDWIKA